MSITKKWGEFYWEVEPEIDGEPSFDRSFFNDGLVTLTWQSDYYSLTVMIRDDGAIGFGGYDYSTKQNSWTNDKDMVQL